VSRYWELKQAKRWDEVYDGFLDPQSRAKIPRDAFLEKRKLAYDILSFSMDEAGQDGDRVVVTVTNEANIPVPAGHGEVQMVRRKLTTADTWVRVDGVWYVHLDE
jgi:hypothetical protein